MPLMLVSRMPPLFLIAPLILLASACDQGSESGGGTSFFGSNAKPLSDVESLVAPIALYPDPLLAELLAASTYPQEIAQAAGWLEARADPDTLSEQGWDASIMRLVEIPQIIKMMNDHPQWTSQLGDAFLSDPDKLIDSIQALRLRSTRSGFLNASPEQRISVRTVSEPKAPETASAQKNPTVSENSGAEAKSVESQREVVFIEPGKSDRLYLPQYEPEAAFSARLAPPPRSDTAPRPSGDDSAAIRSADYYPFSIPSANNLGGDGKAHGRVALVKGLATWGAIEWVDDGHWDSDYRKGYRPAISHQYGDTVCQNGICRSAVDWYGTGARVGRSVGVLASPANVAGGAVASQEMPSDLATNRQGWVHDPSHRLTARYPEGVKEKLKARQPVRAGQARRSLQVSPNDTPHEASQRLHGDARS